MAIGTLLDVLRRGAAKLLPAAATGLLLVVVLSRLGGTGGLAQGTLAPPLTTRLADGASLHLEGPPGEIVVLNFWASWCPPCRAEAPALSAVHARLVAGGLGRVVALSLDRDGADRVEGHAARLGLHVPVGRAREADVRAFAVEQLPTTYVISAEGRIVRALVGEASEGALEAAIDRARAASGSSSAAPRGEGRRAPSAASGQGT